MADQALNSASCTRGSRRGSRPRRIRERPDRGGLVGSAVAEMAAPEALAAVGLKHMEAAFAAVRAEKNAGAAEDTARQAKHRATYMTMACVAVADAVRQLTYKRAKKRMEQGNTQDGDEVIMRNYKSVAAYNAYVHNTLQVDVNSDDRISDTKFKKYVKYFWLFGHKYGPLEFNNVTIDHAAQAFVLKRKHVITAMHVI